MEPARQNNLVALRVALANPGSWLAGPGAHGFSAACAKTFKKLDQHVAKHGAGPAVVAQANPAAYLASALGAIERQLPVVLANPRWGEVEREQAAIQIKPGLWLGEKKGRWSKRKPPHDFDAAIWPGTILIATGGTGGRVRWAVHRWATLSAAAHALAKFLDADHCTHVSTLPPWHVSGLMPAVRAIETGGHLWLENWKNLEAGAQPAIEPERAIISLVPTQLQRLLKQRVVVDWLRGTKAILLGGSAPTAALLAQARRLRLPITLAYGMTETAAVVAAQTPEDFLDGQAPRVTPLPHAQIKIGEAGRIVIQAKSLFAGYYPNHRGPGPFATEDLGALDAQGRLQLRGRLNQVIITGGEKVNPAAVERQIRATGLVKDVRVVGLPDAEWGECVTAIYTGRIRPAKMLRGALTGKLAPWAVPKKWIHSTTTAAGGKKLG